jgi:hypothetical protein
LPEKGRNDGLSKKLPRRKLGKRINNERLRSRPLMIRRLGSLIKRRRRRRRRR